MATGKVKRFDAGKGYGFITKEDGSGDIFVHISQTGGVELKEGQIVEYTEGQGQKGPAAENVQVIEGKVKQMPSRDEEYKMAA